MVLPTWASASTRVLAGRPGNDAPVGQPLVVMVPSPSASARVLVAVSVWPWVGVPVMVTEPVGASLTLATAAVALPGRDAFRRAVPIGVAGGDGDGLADLGFGQHEGWTGRPGNDAAVGQPLVGNGTQSVGVGQGVGWPSGVWPWVGVPVMVTEPVGASLTLATAAVALLVMRFPAVPCPSV